MTLTEARTGQHVKYRAGDVELTAYLSEPTTPGSDCRRETCPHR